MMGPVGGRPPRGLVAGTTVDGAFRPGLLLVAGAMATLSLGLPWAVHASRGLQIVMPPPMYYGAPVTPYMNADIAVGSPWVIESGGGVEAVAGFSEPVRVIGAVAAVMMWFAVRMASRRLAAVALLVAATAIPLNVSSLFVASGRILYTTALVVAGVGIGLQGRVRPWVPGVGRGSA